MCARPSTMRARAGRRDAPPFRVADARRPLRAVRARRRRRRAARLCREAGAGADARAARLRRCSAATGSSPTTTSARSAASRRLTRLHRRRGEERGEVVLLSGCGAGTSRVRPAPLQARRKQSTRVTWRCLWRARRNSARQVYLDGQRAIPPPARAPRRAAGSPATPAPAGGRRTPPRWMWELQRDVDVLRLQAERGERRLQHARVPKPRSGIPSVPSGNPQRPGASSGPTDDRGRRSAPADPARPAARSAADRRSLLDEAEVGRPIVHQRVTVSVLPSARRSSIPGWASWKR